MKSDELKNERFLVFLCLDRGIYTNDMFKRCWEGNHSKVIKSRNKYRPSPV